MQGCLDQFADEEIELLSQLSAAANRPLNWNVLTIDAREPDRVPRQLGAGDRAAEVGGRLVALTMPVRRADEHELPQLLRALAAAGMEGRDGAAGAGPHREAARR